MGWHVEVIAPIAILAEAAGVLGRANVTVVIDHYGVYGHSTPDSADGRVLLDLVALPHVWMKLSAPYRVSDDPLNTRPDPAWLAAILDRGRERCVWGSDWPHTPGHDAQHGPDVAGVQRPLPYSRLVDDFIGALGSDELQPDDHERQSGTALRFRRLTAAEVRAAQFSHCRRLRCRRKIGDVIRANNPAAAPGTQRPQDPVPSLVPVGPTGAFWVATKRSRRGQKNAGRATRRCNGEKTP